MLDRNYNMLCKVAGSQEGPTRSTFAKCMNIVIAGLTHLELDAMNIPVEDDECDPNEWTDE